MKKYTPVQKKIINNVQKLTHLDRKNWQVGEKYYEGVSKSIYGCLHFISDEFGSAFCYDGKNGYIMTCAHCVVEDSDFEEDNAINQEQDNSQDDEPQKKKRGRPRKNPLPVEKKKQIFNLIFANGDEVECVIVKFCKKLDIAVLQIVEKDKMFNKIYQQVEILSEGDLKKYEELLCIGQPAYHDLESKKQGNTNFPPFYVSNGYLEGYTLDPIYGVKEKGLGPLKHSCWTYWGHSGSPIVNLNGQVVGMHNSWNDVNGMRHGVSIYGIRQFQKLYPNLFEQQENKQMKQ